MLLAEQLRILDIGDQVRSFEFADNAGRQISLDRLAFQVKPIVLAFLPAAAHPRWQAEIAGFMDAHARLDALGAPVIAVSPDAIAAIMPRLQEAPPFMLLTDERGQLRHALGEAGDAEGVALVLGPDLRVAARIAGEAGATLAARVLARCEALCSPRPEPLVTMQAPVLLIRDALPLAWCDKLIAFWQAREKVTERERLPDAPGAVYDPLVKRRHDVVFDDPVLVQEVQAFLQRRVVGEIKKAFHYVVRSGETQKIGCYDSRDAGMFRAHRDNHVPACAHRRFAMSLNLNGDFEGGAVRFPEFPGPLYRPPAGAALVFSCSLLHEVTPVTAGKRFGLFSFFW